MRKKAFMIAIISVLTVAALFGAARVVLGSGSTDIPVAYVISDGTNSYYINYDELVDSYMVYMDDPDADSARLAKFYFDTLGSNIMDRFKAYVSGVTTKFVNFGELIDKYMETEDVDSTYMWFNGFAATPAFSEITKVLVLDSGCNVAGRYYVGTDGYIIRRSTYVLDTTAPNTAKANDSAEFAITVTSNDMGCESFTGILRYEITGGDYTLEYNNGGTWETMAGGFIGPPTGETITPDWNTSVDMRFTARGSGNYNLTFRLETDGGEIVAERTQTIFVTDDMQISTDVPTFRVNELAQFTIMTSANSDEGRMVQAHFTIPSGAVIEYLDDVTGDWESLPTVYGPALGFAVADDTMMLRAIFAGSGIKTLSVQYIEVGTGTVLASKDITATVELQMAVSAELPEFYVGEPALFTLTTTANDDAGKLVQARFTIPAGVALEYQEEGTGTWVLLTGVYGSESGFPVADATYTFRAAINESGMKSIGMEFVEVSTGLVLGRKDIVAMAWNRLTPTIALPGFKDMTIRANTTDVSVDLKNPLSNSCFFIISLELEDGTILFSSDLLAPGEGIDNITLSAPLSHGEYNAIVRYDAFDMDDNTIPLNSAEVKIILIVE